ncbi:MAG: filamentous hemagglutinin N-terminal domain-containing protein, partial [Leptolyngbya sp. SIO3F4]|nr:filamentous hemagglutinin N-terminal domain-containing protein [Leptolyngbya sp. SIO3F4]
MLPVALLAVTIPQQPADIPHPVPPLLSPSAQPVFNNGTQPDLLLAQSITPADTNTVVTSTDNQIDITGGHLSGDGGNLFHSFQQFGLGDQQTANFVANPQVQNVLGRVLGGDASYIDGILHVSNSDANLYLINPAGILFGQNAQLDLTGSFTAATANRIGFGGSWWEAIGTSDYDQMVGDPTQFSFSAFQPGSVVNLGDLAVGENQDLTLLGGNVVNTGSVSAPGGRITLASSTGPQTITLGSTAGLLTMELSPEDVDLTLSPLSLPQLLTGGNVNEDSGLIVSPDGTVLLQGVAIPEDGGITAVSGNLDVAKQQGGEINVLGDRVALLGADLDASSVADGGTVRIGGGYQGNDAIPNADITYVDPESTIYANAGETGDGGLVILWADGLTQFYGDIEARGGSQVGDGGFVEVSGKTDLAFDGDVDLTAPNGNSGHLLLDPGFVNIDNIGTNDATAFGAIQPNQITQTQGGNNQTFSISAGRVETALNSNNVTIAAARGIRVNEEINTTGTSNDLTLEAPEIDVFEEIILDGGDINLIASDSSVQTAQGITLFAVDNALSSNGGDITLTGPRIEIDGSINSDGGDITFNGPVVVDDSFGFNPHVVSSGSGPGTIRFNNTLDSTQFGGSSQENSLTVTAGTGDVFFEDAIGSVDPLGDLYVADINQFNSLVTSGNNIEVKDFLGNQLAVRAFENITIDATGELSASLNLRSRNNGRIEITAPGNIALTDSSISNNDGGEIEILTPGNISLSENSSIGGSSNAAEIQLTALTGNITLDGSTVDGFSGNALLEAQSIEVLNNSELRSRETFRLETQGVGNFITIQDSTVGANQLFISSPGGTVRFNNSRTPEFGDEIEEIQVDARLIDVEANSRLNLSADQFSPFDGVLRLEATESVNVDASSLRANQTVELIAADTVQITDGITPSIIRSGNNLLVQGGQVIDIQNLNQPQSALIANNNLTLVSDGTVTGQGRFLSGGDFSILTLSDTPGTFSYTPTTSNGIISSGGSVSFGTYIGDSLKVEAGGDITVDGNISITAPNTNLQGTDSEIAILSSEPALILRAGLTGFNPQNALPGVDELRNTATLPPDRVVGATTFTASDGNLANGNITVGSVDTAGGPVILAAQGDVSTGDITTGDAGFDIKDFG